MASFLYLYNEITHKINQTILLMRELREENKELKNKNLELQNEIKELQGRIHDLETKNRIITTSKTLLLRNDKKENIKILNEFVREIDNCIKLINGIEWNKKK